MENEIKETMRKFLTQHREYIDRGCYTSLFNIALSQMHPRAGHGGLFFDPLNLLLILDPFINPTAKSTFSSMYDTFIGEWQKYIIDMTSLKYRQSIADNTVDFAAFRYWFYTYIFPSSGGRQDWIDDKILLPTFEVIKETKWAIT